MIRHLRSEMAFSFYGGAITRSCIALSWIFCADPIFAKSSVTGQSKNGSKWLFEFRSDDEDLREVLRLFCGMVEPTVCC
jgi:hypothetical protein